MSKGTKQYGTRIFIWTDLFSVIAAYIITLHFRYTFFEAVGKYDYPYLWITIAVAEVVYLSILTFNRVYKNIIKYASVKFFMFLTILSFLAGFVMMLLSFVVPREYFMDWKGNMLASLFATGLILLSRGIVRMSAIGISRPKNDIGYKNILIVGAGSAGQWLINSIQSAKDTNYVVIGMVDDDREKIGKIIHGVSVLGNSECIPGICEDKKPNEIVIAIPSIDDENRKRIFSICAGTGVLVRTLPSIGEIVDNSISADAIKQIRNVSIEDLLVRKSIELDNKLLHGTINNKVVMVTGGGGSIGSELCRQIAKHGPGKLVILDIYENNAYDLQMELQSMYPQMELRVVIASVRDRERIEQVFEHYRPSVVFHAAAHKHVPLMEYNPGESIKNNVFGTYNVVNAADKYGTDTFVLISTDKAVNPTNVMGATKRICEMIVQSMCGHSKTKFVAVRFGNVLGSNGSVIPLFKKQIEKREPITVTHKEITRFFMTIPEAAQLVLQAACYAEGGEIFVLDMGQPVKIYDLAINLIRLSGLKPYEDIDIRITGLRPGEKLYEELLMDEEGLKATANSKIFVGQPICIDKETLEKSLEKLDKAMKNCDREYIKDIIAEVVPTYVRKSISTQHRENVNKDVIA